MRMAWAAATVVIAGSACGASSAAPGGSTGSAGATSVHCGPSAARTITEDRRARIYAVGSRVYGCTSGGRRAYLLGQRSRSRPGGSQISEIALAGVVAGYAESESGVDTLSTAVVVRRLDNGRTLHDVNAIKGTLGPEFFESVDALVVRADGAAAWIASGGSIVRSGKKVEVDRLDRRGEATLDTGSGIAGRSLRLRGSRVSWRDAGSLRTSTLL